MTTPLNHRSTLTAIPTNDLHGIWAEVKANQAKLEHCPRHEFHAVDPGKLGTRYECKCCGGRTDVSSVRWYQKGLAHANNNH